jgi:hypothetical protein
MPGQREGADAVVRVAMWSGPRNISTAMMRSWDARADCVVVDEPLYAFYLDRTGSDHPGRDAVLRSQSTDWRAVVDALVTAPLPGGATVQYQKHMTHHLLPEVDRAELAGLRHAFLVREPGEVLRSYARVRSEPTLQDLGMAQQVEVYERFGGPVVDARDVLTDPAGTLRSLCTALDLAYDPGMLSWAPGPRDTDGVWADHWYGAVRESTGFAPYRPPADPLPDRLLPLLDLARPYYDALAVHRLGPTRS